MPNNIFTISNSLASLTPHSITGKVYAELPVFFVCFLQKKWAMLMESERVSYRGYLNWWWYIWTVTMLAVQHWHWQHTAALAVTSSLNHSNITKYKKILSLLDITNMSVNWFYNYISGVLANLHLLLKNATTQSKIWGTCSLLFKIYFALLFWGVCVH